jgi:hypothetical protein
MYTLLCDPCQSIFEGPLEASKIGKTGHKEGPHHKALTVLESAAKSCVLCALLLRNVSLRTRKDLREKVGLSFSLYYNWIQPDLSHLDFIYLNEENRRFVAAGFYLTSKWNSRDLEVNSTGSSNTGSDRSLQKVSQWINNCENNHTLCNGPRTYIPKRLLEITSRDLSNENYREDGKLLRLVESGSLPITTRYITLSYCWGGLEVMNLKRNTKEALKRGIHITELPLTFVEASNAALRLGVRYLWIDALCIFQDSRDDWLDQSSQMSSIYENSVCTFAAIASYNSQGGLFRDRLPGLDEPLIVHPTWPGSHPESIACLPIYGERAEISIDGGYAPLMLRGWAFQERLISRRVIFFCQTQIQFKCRELHQSDSCLPTDKVHGTYHGSGDTDTWARSLRSKGSRFNKVDLFDLWNSTVSDYSECELSRYADKLPALSGLAKQFQDCLRIAGIEATYLAGLWRSDLPNGLLWMSSTNENLNHFKPRRSINYRAPSWSWASIDGLVGFWFSRPDDEDEYMIEILSAATTSEMDPVGPVIAAALVLRARLATVIIESYEPCDRGSRGGIGEILIAGERVDCDLYWDDIALRDDTLHNQAITLVPVRIFKLTYQNCYLERVVGLILEKFTKEGANVYQRLGLYLLSTSTERPCSKLLFTFEGCEESVITLI